MSELEDIRDLLYKQEKERELERSAQRNIDNAINDGLVAASKVITVLCVGMLLYWSWLWVK